MRCTGRPPTSPTPPPEPPSGEGGGAGDDEDDDVPVSGSRAERYQAFLFVDADTLCEDGEPGRSELEDGTRVAPASARRLAWDVAAVQVNRAADGSVLDVGRRTRAVPPALRRALEVRDRGCRFPGCGLRFTDAHHITHWADGGDGAGRVGGPRASVTLSRPAASSPPSAATRRRRRRRWRR